MTKCPYKLDTYKMAKATGTYYMDDYHCILEIDHGPTHQTHEYWYFGNDYAVMDQPKKPKTDYNTAEKRKARKDGAKLVKNSGRGEVKGDASKGNLLIDYKFTEAKSYSLNLEQWLKHNKDALKTNKFGVVVAVFSNHGDRSIAMVDWEYLQELEEIRWKYEALGD